MLPRFEFGDTLLISNLRLTAQYYMQSVASHSPNQEHHWAEYNATSQAIFDHTLFDSSRIFEYRKLGFASSPTQ